MRLAHNRCNKCAHEWWDFPGMFARLSKDGCPKCGSLYWTWLNYEKEFKR